MADKEPTSTTSRRLTGRGQKKEFDPAMAKELSQVAISLGFVQAHAHEMGPHEEGRRLGEGEAGRLGLPSSQPDGG